MTVLSIVTYPDLRLKMVSDPVEAVTDTIRTQIDDMFETMYASNGIGLAAVQVGILNRILVLDIEQDDERNPGKPMAFINPKVTWESEERKSYQEGCLSFPGQYAEVIRPDEIKLRYLDANGDEQELHADGLLSICLQHEMDHLNGITFTDHLSRIKRDMIHRKVKKLTKDA